MNLRSYQKVLRQRIKLSVRHQNAIVGASVAKPVPAIQLSNAQVVILPQAQVQETQGSSSDKTLPNTGSDESVSATLAGLVLMTLAGFFGIKKSRKNLSKGKSP